MDVFDLGRSVVADYANFARSFSVIRAADLRTHIDQIYAEGRFWPEPLLQLNPHYKPGGSVRDLVQAGTLDPGCAAYFRDPYPEPGGDSSLKLRVHQREAIAKATQGLSFVVTTGTGSGKSLCYFIPIVDVAIRAVRAGEGRRTRAIVVYPMNALANSQLGELRRYLGQCSGIPEVTFARYTGQESAEEREAIRNDPPDILLTNFVMLELLMTRQNELDRRVIENCAGLDFLVLDELHTYRGRQGADVAMLIRRVRERLEGERPIQCIGTSATMASEGSRDDRDAIVADVASRLFGTMVTPDCVITETLQRATDPTRTADHVKAELGSAIDAPIGPNLSNAAMSQHPLAIWVETRLGLSATEAGAWARAEPSRLSEAADKLAEASERTADACRTALQAFLLEASRPESDRVPGGKQAAFFAFKLHQFLAGAGRAYTTLDAPGARRVTVDGQVFDPKAPHKRLFALYFCRRCGQEFHPVTLIEAAAGARHLIARSIDDAPVRDSEAAADDETRETPGFLMPPTDGLAFDGQDEAYPEAWQELTKRGEIRLKASYRKTRAQALSVEDTGRVSSSGHAYWFLPGRFRFCPSCGDYHTTSARDINRLAGLTAEGRSSATTVLASSIVRWMNGPDGAAIPAHRRKVLAFTDNRQDAALQAGHFNDFAFVTQFRAAILAALAGAGPDGIGDGEVATAMQKLLGFTRDRQDGRIEWLLVPELKGANLINAESDLRGVLLHRFWVDQRRGWRFTHPSLEELGFIDADYLSLDELVADEAMFAGVPDPLRHASPRERAAAFRILFDVLRKGLAVNAPSLDRHHVEDLKGRSVNVHRAPWGFGRDEKPRDATWMMLAAPSRQDVKIRDEVLLLRGGPRSLLGRGLRAATLWGGASVTEQDYGPLVRAMLEAAKAYGLVSVGGTPFGEGEDSQGWRLEASAVRFRRAPPDGAAGRGPPNPYFVALYTSLAARLERGEASQLRIEGREHTAQVTGDRREIREERFRFEKEDQDKLVARGEQLKDLGEDDRFLPVLFCSPTMELGVDISALNAVYLRNVPPTPANYAQRSGRAGRSGQAALVLTYCAAQSPHDQYFFADQRAMVHGVVRPPALDLSNRELVESHLDAIWLAATEQPLPPSIAELLALSQSPLPVLEAIREKLAAPDAAKRARPRMERFLAQLEGALPADVLAEIGEGTLKGAPTRFESSFDRWRDLFRAANQQLDDAHRIISDHSTGNREHKAAQERHRQAANQLNLLKRRSESQAADFYTYRYLATEGFLPGYNFPRLPLMAYVPESREGTGRQTFLQRARFLGISEFGPRSLVYHEGRAFRVAKAMLGPAARGGEDGKLATRALDICRDCGAAHEHRSRDLCHVCGASLADAALVRDVFRIENVETIPAERISINDEERQRQGFDIQTLFAWASRGGRRDVREAHAVEGDAEVLCLSYGPGATVTRLNKGLRRRRNPEDLGFVIDPRTGYWAKADDETDGGEGEGARGQKVVPAVEENKNALHLRPWGALAATAPDALVTLQHALLRGIEASFQLEAGEVVGEPLPSRADRRAILLYEATEGGAGVLSRLVGEPDALARVARKALEIMHYAPPDDLDGIAAEDLPQRDDACAAGCYRCVLSYYNQPDHEAIDRRAPAVKDALLRLARARVRPAQTTVTQEAGDRAPAEPDQSPDPALDDLLWRWRDALQGLDGSGAEPLGGDGRIVVWRDHYVAASLGDPAPPARDHLRAKGFDLIVFPAIEADWASAAAQLSSLIGG